MQPYLIAMSTRERIGTNTKHALLTVEQHPAEDGRVSVVRRAVPATLVELSLTLAHAELGAPHDGQHEARLGLTEAALAARQPAGGVTQRAASHQRQQAPLHLAEVPACTGGEDGRGGSQVRR